MLACLPRRLRLPRETIRDATVAHPVGIKIPALLYVHAEIQQNSIIRGHEHYPHKQKA